MLVWHEPDLLELLAVHLAQGRLCLSCFTTFCLAMSFLASGSGSATLGWVDRGVINQWCVTVMAALVLCLGLHSVSLYVGLCLCLIFCNLYVTCLTYTAAAGAASTEGKQ